MNWFHFVLALISLLWGIVACDFVHTTRDSGTAREMTNQNNAMTRQEQIRNAIAELRRASAKSSALLAKSPVEKAEWDEYERLRGEITQLIERIVSFGEEANPFVLELLKEQDSELRAYSSIMLGEINHGKSVPNIILALIIVIPDVERPATFAHMGALVKIGRSTLPALLEVLENGDPVKRVALFEVVKIITGEPFVFFDPQGTQAQRKEAVQRIRQWIKEKQ